MAPIKCPRKNCEWTTEDNPIDICGQLLRIHGDEHNVTDMSSNQPNKTEKMDKPTIEKGCNLEGWAFFQSEWNDFKLLTKPSKQDISLILLQCCQAELKKDLRRSHANLGSKDEDFVMAAIKERAVPVENIVVSRVALLQMKQDADESVRSYEARLKGQANVCNYSLKPTCPSCDHEFVVYYTEEQVRDVLVSGLADNEIRSDVLSDVKQEIPLDKIVQLIESKEVGKKSSSRFSDIHKISAVKSAYKREMNQGPRNHNHGSNGNYRNTNRKTQSCGWCGKQNHGNFKDIEIRRKVCPAFHHICKICNRKGHYEKSCRQETHHYKPNTSALNTESHDISFETEDQVGAIKQQD